MSTQTKSKTELRSAGKLSRRSMSTDERCDASLSIAESVFRLPLFQRAMNVAIYLPAEEEVNTWPIIERSWRTKKRIFAPIARKSGDLQFCELAQETTLVRNRFKLLEPAHGKTIKPNALDIVFTPLVAFDNRRQRIGMGGGFYDRTFAFANLRQSYHRPKLIGLAFACQQVDFIPENSWDIPLFQIVTEHSDNR